MVCVRRIAPGRRHGYIYCVTDTPETSTTESRSTAAPWILSTLIFAATVVALHAEGRRWWCACGKWYPWASGIWSEHCSQHLLDPYSFTHVEHGLIAFAVLAWIFPARSLAWRRVATLTYACAWEVFENSTFIIERFRTRTVSLNYVGDSIGNSVGDILSCFLGFYIARKLGLRRSFIIFVVLELALLITVRDNLTLNILMLIHPVEAIRTWQMNGAG